MAWSKIAYWLDNAFISGQPPRLRRLKSTASAGTAFPPAPPLPPPTIWDELGPNLVAAFPGVSFSLSDVQTNPANNEHVIVIGGISGSFKGIALSKDAGNTWVNPIMPTLPAYTAFAQIASSGLFTSPFDMTTCGFTPTASPTARAIHWFDNNNIYVAVGPYILNCSNWLQYVSGAGTPTFTIVSAIHDCKTISLSSPPVGVSYVPCATTGPNQIAVAPPPSDVRALYFESLTKGVCATVNGIFITNNGGASWIKISDDNKFQTYAPAAYVSPAPFVYGTWGVDTFLGIHLNGNTIVAVAKNYIITGTFNAGVWTWSPTSCAVPPPPTPNAGNIPPCPNVTAIGNQWRSLNWNKDSAGLYRYYASGTNNKIYTSGNTGLNWTSYLQPDTDYTPAALYRDYQDLSFYSNSECFIAFGDATVNPVTNGLTATEQIIDGTLSAVYDRIVGNVTITSTQSVPDQRYMAVWVGVNPPSTPPPPPPVEKWYLLTNCNPNATVPVMCTNDASVAPYVSSASNPTIAITGLAYEPFPSRPSINETTSDCWTVKEVQSCTSNIYEIRFTVGNNPAAAYQFEVFDGSNPCVACLPPEPDPTLCVLLIECDSPYTETYVLITGQDQVDQWAQYMGLIITVPGLCFDKCLYVNPCPTGEHEYVELPQDYEVTVFANCAECKGLPPPRELHTRRVKPGFYTPGCPPEYTVKTSCAFAEQAYDEMVSVRYGINICCDHDIDKWDIKKQILELKALYDECLCQSNLCPICIAPCNVSAKVEVYYTVTPDPPEPPPPPPCLQPDPTPIDVILTHG